MSAHVWLELFLVDWKCPKGCCDLFVDSWSSVHSIVPETVQTYLACHPSWTRLFVLRVWPVYSFPPFSAGIIMGVDIAGGRGSTSVPRSRDDTSRRDVPSRNDPYFTPPRIFLDAPPSPFCIFYHFQNKVSRNLEEKLNHRLRVALPRFVCLWIRLPQTKLWWRQPWLIILVATIPPGLADTLLPKWLPVSPWPLIIFMSPLWVPWCPNLYSTFW